MTARPQFSPICDVHHTPMYRVMLEEDSEDVRSYHACQRPNCTRVFRLADGYSDIVGGQFDDSRATARTCSACGSALYLSEVNHSLKVETWECTGSDCDFCEGCPSPSGR